MLFFETVTLTPKLPKCTSTKSLRCIKVFRCLHSSTVCFVSSAKNKAGHHTLWIHLSCLAHQCAEKYPTFCVFSLLWAIRERSFPLSSPAIPPHPHLSYITSVSCVWPQAASLPFFHSFFSPVWILPKSPSPCRQSIHVSFSSSFLSLVSYALRQIVVHQKKKY